MSGIKSKDIPSRFAEAMKTEVTDAARITELENALGDYDYKQVGTIADMFGFSASKTLPERVDDLENNGKIKYHTPQPATTKASLVVGESDIITFEAKTAGTVGNGITIEILSSDAEKAFALRLDGTDISIDLATNSSLEVTTTYQDIVDAITDTEDPNYIAGVAALITASISGGPNLICPAIAQTNLAGGLNNGTSGVKGCIMFDESFVYIALDDVDGSADMSNWGKIAISPFVEE